MSARYTRAEFEAVGLKPNECDSGPYGSHITTSEPTYWFACDYHEGFIDGFNAVKDEGLPQGLPVPTHGIEGITTDDVDEFLREIGKGSKGDGG